MTRDALNVDASGSARLQVCTQQVGVTIKSSSRYARPLALLTAEPRHFLPTLTRAREGYAQNELVVVDEYLSCNIGDGCIHGVVVARRMYTRVTIERIESAYTDRAMNTAARDIVYP